MFLRNFFKGCFYLVPIYLLSLAFYWFVCISIDSLSGFPFLAWIASFIFIVVLIWHAHSATRDEIKNKARWDNYNAEKKAVIDAYTKRFGS